MDNNGAPRHRAIVVNGIESLLVFGHYMGVVDNPKNTQHRQNEPLNGNVAATAKSLHKVLHVGSIGALQHIVALSTLSQNSRFSLLDSCIRCASFIFYEI